MSCQPVRARIELCLVAVFSSEQKQRPCIARITIRYPNTAVFVLQARNMFSSQTQQSCSAMQGTRSSHSQHILCQPDTHAQHRQPLVQLRTCRSTLCMTACYAPGTEQQVWCVAQPLLSSPGLTLPGTSERFFALTSRIHASHTMYLSPSFFHLLLAVSRSDVMLRLRAAQPLTAHPWTLLE